MNNDIKRGKEHSSSRPQILENNTTRKVASICMMAIMVAGGMTIAIPSMTPQAAAQSMMLSVSADAAPDNTFGGPQVIEIVVDDPDRRETGSGSNFGPGPSAPPEVTANDKRIKMTQSESGKWYGYVIAEGATDRFYPLINFLKISDNIYYPPADTLLSGAPDRPTGAKIDSITMIDLDGEFEVKYGSESITLNYDEDGVDEDVIVDRRNVPNTAQVHIAISDFRLNLDPTREDIWALSTDGEFAAYDSYHYFEIERGDVNYIVDPGVNLENWDIFTGDAGEFTITGDAAEIDYRIKPGNRTAILFEETGANTGIFVSYDSNDMTPLTARGIPGNQFDVGYGDASTQVFVDDFDTRVELIADDSTWNAAEELTIRVTNENLNLNTMEDENMSGASAQLPMIMFGEPATLRTVQDSGNLNLNYTASTGDWDFLINDDTHAAKVALLSDGSFIFSKIENSQALNPVGFPVPHTPAEVAALIEEVKAVYADEDIGPVLAHQLDNAIDTADAGTNIFDLAGNIRANIAAIQPIINEKLVIDVDLSTMLPALQNDALMHFVHSSSDEFTIKTDAQLDMPADDDGDGYVELDGVTEIKVSDDADGKFQLVITPKDDPVVYPTEGYFIADIFTFGDGINNAIYRATLEELNNSVFEGTIKYVMTNHLSTNKTYAMATHASADLTLVLSEAYTGITAPTVSYDGIDVSQDAPTHTGQVSLDSEKYNVGDDVTITLMDPDLQRDVGAIDAHQINAIETDENLRLLNIGIGSCSNDDVAAAIKDIRMLFLRETGDATSNFTASFEVPSECGTDSGGNPILTTGSDISVTYYDSLDESSKENEWSASATIGADTGSIQLDRTVYPVPGSSADMGVKVHISVTDADYNESSFSLDEIQEGRVEIKILDNEGNDNYVNKIGKLRETAPDSAIFTTTITLVADSGDVVADTHHIPHLKQGSIITVRYNDATDASGSGSTASDSATFDLRTAVLQSDKSTYTIGQDALITLIEPDLNYDSDNIDVIDLNMIHWDSDAYSEDAGLKNPAFGAVPSNLRETGPNTGIFQTVIEIPEVIDDEALGRGEEITLTYTDMSPSGANMVSADDLDIDLYITTSDFGSTLDLDQRVYTWTDKVFITVVASDYNFDSNVIDEIGEEGKGKITIRTREGNIPEYRLSETGPDTGVFAGEITLVGFKDVSNGLNNPWQESSGSGHTDGVLESGNEDGISVSFDYSSNEPSLVASAVIRWNVGEIQWLEPSYASTDSGVVRVIDPDMNLNPDAVDSMGVVIYSETYVGGIDLIVTETNESTGIFQGTVEFDLDRASQGHRLQVTEGDIVTAVYEDRTLPKPDGRGDSRDIMATTIIGAIVPPLERAPVSDPRIVDAIGNEVTTVSAGQQIQITADMISGQDVDQDFAYLVQIQDENGVTAHLSWITGSLGAGKTFSPSQSWTPDETGTYSAAIFVWESVDNPTALSPQISLSIDVV